LWNGLKMVEIDLHGLKHKEVEDSSSDEEE
jgi:hypothetical protein